MTFRYLVNLGSPTRWDVGRYFEYRDSHLHGLPIDLVSMVADERFALDSDSTFWHSRLVSIQGFAGELNITMRSASRDKLYVFGYSGIQRVATNVSVLKSMPTMIVQELVVLRNGTYRHAMVDIIGRRAVVHATSISFSELGQH